MLSWVQIHVFYQYSYMTWLGGPLENAIDNGLYAQCGTDDLRHCLMRNERSCSLRFGTHSERHMTFMAERRGESTKEHLSLYVRIA